MLKGKLPFILSAVMLLGGSLVALSASITVNPAGHAISGAADGGSRRHLRPGQNSNGRGNSNANNNGVGNSNMNSNMNTNGGDGPKDNPPVPPPPTPTPKPTIRVTPAYPL